MSLVPITVEHPQYTQTFVVQVPQAGTVNDIKQEIARVCPGNPQVNGQRLISKGRVLNDEETIEALWVVSVSSAWPLLVTDLVIADDRRLRMRGWYTWL